MSTTAIATWLLFFGILPVLYWVFSILTEYIRYRFFPPKSVVVEYHMADGRTVSSHVRSSKDLPLYRQVADFVTDVKENNGPTDTGK